MRFAKRKLWRICGWKIVFWGQGTLCCPLEDRAILNQSWTERGKHWHLYLKSQLSVTRLHLDYCPFLVIHETWDKLQLESCTSWKFHATITFPCKKHVSHLLNDIWTLITYFFAYGVEISPKVVLVLEVDNAHFLFHSWEQSHRKLEEVAMHESATFHTILSDLPHLPRHCEQRPLCPHPTQAYSESYG